MIHVYCVILSDSGSVLGGRQFEAAWRDVLVLNQAESCACEFQCGRALLSAARQVWLLPKWRFYLVELATVTVYYVEMRAPSHRVVPVPRDGLTVLEVQAPSVPYYRFLYDSVGKDYNWLSRRKLSDEALADLLNDPLNELHVLHVDGSPAGFAEVDRRQTEDIEMTQFGLFPEFIGQKLGTWFLQWTIDRVWSLEPKRFWLHTCSLDHPAALPTYKKAGFVAYQEEEIRREP